MREFERECVAGGVGSAVLGQVVAQMFGAKPIPSPMAKQIAKGATQDWRAMKAEFRAAAAARNAKLKRENNG